MAFTIYDEANDPFGSPYPFAGPDAVDIDIITAALAGNGVLSGCAVTAQGSPNMTVAVAVGYVQFGEYQGAVTAGNVTITTAHATNPRFDLIVATVGTTGTATLSATAGTAAANPVFPAIPASAVVLAAVYVPATDTTISSNQICDKRFFTGNGLVGQMDFARRPTILGRQDFRVANFGPLLHHYAALAGRSTAPENIIFHGDSVTQGAFAALKANQFTRLTNDGIQNLYKRGGRGFISVGSYLTEWTMGGSPSAITPNTGVGRWAQALTGTTQTATITIVGDRFQVLFSGSTGTGTATIAVDGGTATTFATVAGASDTPFIYTSGALTNGTHTVVISAQAANTVYLDGIVEYNGDYGTGIHTYEVGHTGFTAGDFVGNPEHFNWMKPQYLRPDVVILQFGLNEEALVGTTKATYKANLNSLIDSYIASTVAPTPAIVLMGIWARGDIYKRTDIVTNGTTALTAAGASFPPGLANVNGTGALYEGPDFPAGTTVVTRNSATSLTMSAAATTSGSGKTGQFRYQDAQWQPYRTAMKEIAAERNVAFLDLYDMLGWAGTRGTDSITDFASVSTSSPNFTSASMYIRANFDEGTQIVNPPGWAAGTYYIGSVVNGTTAVLSSTNPLTSGTSTPVNATSVVSGQTAIFTNRPDPNRLTFEGLHPSDKGQQWIADELLRVFTGVPRSGPIAAGIFNNKGELISASAADTPVIVSPGPDGTFPAYAAGSVAGILPKMQSSLGTTSQLVVQPGATTFTASGILPAPTVNGTAANGDDNENTWVQYTTAAATAFLTTGPISSAFTITRGARLPELAAYFQFGASIANVAWWFGLCASSLDVASAVVPASSIQAAYFYLGTGVLDNSLRCVTSNGTTVTTTVTSITPAASTTYRPRLACRGVKGTSLTSVEFYWGDVLLATHTTNLPAAATPLGYGLREQPTGAATKVQKIAWVGLGVP